MPLEDPFLENAHGDTPETLSPAVVLDEDPRDVVAVDQDAPPAAPDVFDDGFAAVQAQEETHDRCGAIVRIDVRDGTLDQVELHFRVPSFGLDAAHDQHLSCSFPCFLSRTQMVHAGSGDAMETNVTGLITRRKMTAFRVWESNASFQAP